MNKKRLILTILAISVLLLPALPVYADEGPRHRPGGRGGFGVHGELTAVSDDSITVLVDKGMGAARDAEELTIKVTDETKLCEWTEDGSVPLEDLGALAAGDAVGVKGRVVDEEFIAMHVVKNPPENPPENPRGKPPEPAS